MNRRLLLAGGIAAVAGAGAGAAWRLSREPALDPAEQAFWDLRMPRPDGSDLAFASFRGRELIVNFWATWCGPCVEEMPALDRFGRRHAVALLGVAVDRADAVRRFLDERPVAYPVAVAGFGGAALARSLGNPAGGLPFTVMFGVDGRKRRHKLGPVDEAELAGWIGRTNAG